MDQTLDGGRLVPRRLVVLASLAIALVLGLGVGARVLHTSTIPNLGLPTSNSKSLSNLQAYDPQVQITREYLLALAALNYPAAYALLAPSSRAIVDQAQFTAARKQEGALGQPSVWADDETSTRAEYILGKQGESSSPRRHRFQLKKEDGRWWIDGELPAPNLPAVSASLAAAMQQFVQQRAGKIWAGSLELLRQEGFEGGQLLLFSYIEPHPPTVLTQQRLAVLNYYVNEGDGWHFQGGGGSGLAAGMSMADLAMGFTSFGPDQKYLAYYGVLENSNAVTLRFEEPNGAGHVQNVKGQRTVLFLNERNPFEQPPFNRPFKSLSLKDVYGNNLRTNPEV